MSYKGKNTETVLKDAEDSRQEDLFFESRRSAAEKVAPEGLNPNNYEYVIMNDGGERVYVSSMYIHKLPNDSTFAITYAGVLSYPGVTKNIFISPLENAQSLIDKRVKNLDTENGEALDSGDRNRIRKAGAKLKKAETWASNIEAGDNSLYKVQFLFTFKAKTEEDLFRDMSNFRSKALQRQIEVVACYALQTEALLSAYPLNRAVQFKKADFIKPFVLDKRAVGDLFNHTSCSFIHQNGVFLGHYMNTSQAFLYDPMDRSHDGYGAIFAGGTGTGKSATIKMLESRLMDFGIRFRSLDLDSTKARGEYALTAEAGRGINYDIRVNGKNILNPFDINEELEYDDATGKEYRVLHLAEKKSYLINLFMSAVTIGEENTEVKLEVPLQKALRRIISDICTELYEERGIEDGHPDSLYTPLSNGFLGSGKARKLVPTISDFFKKLIVKQEINKISQHETAYQTLIDTMQDLVRELYYGEDSLRFFTKKEYEECKSQSQDDAGTAYIDYNNKKERIIVVKGSRSYFDGQSTLHAKFETPYINYDMSQIPKGDRAFAILVLLGYISENDVKPNSANPSRATPLGVVMDELHIVFPYEAARRIVGEFYRTGRKRWIIPWVATQSIEDFGDKVRYPELSAVYDNTDTIFLFRHKTTSRKFLNEGTELTAMQAEKILTLGYDPTDRDVSEEEKERHRGEVCIIDKGRVAFIKVDYLRNSEASYVETNVANIKKEVEKP